MNEEQREEAQKTVIGEFSNVKHVRGILSMGRYNHVKQNSSFLYAICNTFSLKVAGIMSHLIDNSLFL